LISQFYRKTGLKHLFKGRGQSIYCFLARPETEAAPANRPHPGAIANQASTKDRRIEVS
jgi:hypothetical protein